MSSVYRFSAPVATGRLVAGVIGLRGPHCVASPNRLTVSHRKIRRVTCDTGRHDMRTRAFWIASLAGALGLPIALALGDVVLGPPSGVWLLLLWPVDVLLWATGPGTRLTNGKFEWTPVQDFAVWVGIGVSWFLWVAGTFVIARFARRKH